MWHDLTWSSPLCGSSGSPSSIGRGVLAHGVIAASQECWTGLFPGLESPIFSKLINALRKEGADRVRRGRPWSLPLGDRVLLVAVYWRTDLTLRQLGPLFRISKSAAGRIIDHPVPRPAVHHRERGQTDNANPEAAIHITSINNLAKPIRTRPRPPGEEPELMRK